MEASGDIVLIAYDDGDFKSFPRSDIAAFVAGGQFEAAEVADGGIIDNETGWPMVGGMTYYNVG